MPWLYDSIRVWWRDKERTLITMKLTKFLLIVFSVTVRSIEICSAAPDLQFAYLHSSSSAHTSAPLQYAIATASESSNG